MGGFALRRIPGTGRRTAGRLVVLLALLAVVVPVTAGSASAGGPTSVLLVSPDRGATASLYRSETEYGRLQSLIGHQRGKPAGQADPALSLGVGPYITVTWLIHDIKVWRVDRIFVEAPGGPWIATQEVMDVYGTADPAATADPGIGPTLPIPAIWHQAAKPRKLMDLLDDLGLLEPGATVPPRRSADAGFAAAPTPSTAPAAAPAVPRDSDRSGRWWALAGIGAGTLVGAAGTRFAARRPRTRDDAQGAAPRQELLDL